MLIDQSYFVGHLLIPNISGTGPVYEGNAIEVIRNIQTHEPDYLKALLGVELYELFIAGIAETTPAAKWTNLKALIIDTNAKTSPIAGYVYFHYMRDRVSIMTGAGEAVSNNENSNPALVQSKMIRAWNNMSNQSDKIIEFLIENSSTYPEWDSSENELLETINQFGL